MRVVVIVIIVAQCYAKFGLANDGEPGDLEIKAHIDPKSVMQIDDTMEKIEGDTPYEQEKSNVAGLPDLNASEVVLVFVDVQNDFTDYHSSATEGYTKPSLPVPGSKEAISVMNAIRLAGKFKENDGDAKSQLCAIYRSEDYHVADSFTFASSHCWKNSWGKQFFVRKENSQQWTKITEYKKYTFDLVTNADNSKDVIWKSSWEITVWPPHCVVGTYGQMSHAALLKDNANDRIVLKAVYKYRESLTAVVESYVLKQSIVEEPNKYNNYTRSVRKLINMKLDLAEHCPNAKYIVVMGFEYMNCVGETAKSLANLTRADGEKYTVIIPTDAVGYFAQPTYKKRMDMTAKLRNLHVKFVNSKYLAFKHGTEINHVNNYYVVDNPATP